MAKVPKAISNNRILKEYKNEIDGISLNFNLYVDTTTDLIKFLELLKRATVEVEADIKKIQAERKK